MGSYELTNRKIGDGYTYYKVYTPDTGAGDPYGEPTLIETKADDQTFGGTNVNGAELGIEREILEDEISQELSAIQRLIIGEKGSFKMTINTGRLDNVALAVGKNPTDDISDVDAGNLPGSNPGKSVLIGGNAALEFLSLVHEVQNSVSPNLKEWAYMPRCQSAEGFTFGFKRNVIREAELNFTIYPALQDNFLVGSKHALIQLIYEYTA